VPHHHGQAVVGRASSIPPTCSAVSRVASADRLLARPLEYCTSALNTVGCIRHARYFSSVPPLSAGLGPDTSVPSAARAYIDTFVPGRQISEMDAKEVYLLRDADLRALPFVSSEHEVQHGDAYRVYDEVYLYSPILQPSSPFH
jgi:hypothetical protein